MARTPHRKVMASAVGAGFGAATATLINGSLADLFNSGHPVPTYLSDWIIITVPLALAGVAGYFTRAAPSEE